MVMMYVYIVISGGWPDKNHAYSYTAFTVHLHVAGPLDLSDLLIATKIQASLYPLFVYVTWYSRDSSSFMLSLSEQSQALDGAFSLVKHGLSCPTNAILHSMAHQGTVSTSVHG